ncbi:fibrinogen-like YCDxxxxGGGW domain-containing protein [Pseudoalteromonas sp. S16_S37]|uniref:fibrinogen-like YCDxxxxGGGW domain-containing protein n=1 Tax=Pseudoalteromonas sp. S16_S37 TaxID=2720228 RepID=UPI0016803D1B|nr:fibrinogen-like YCDxxxxGGGW domain-containing protein [Pseudoalteromonas sp. S16_S37]MBD1582639.1 hypothetical protein [Pseudoalteromonas sp. S16_S37]
MKYNGIALAVALCSSSVLAQSEFNKTHTIYFDNVLDGQLVNQQSMDFDFKGTNEHFVAKNDVDIVSGRTSVDEQLVHFEISQPDLNTTMYFTGSLSDTTYTGTWYSNQGTRGDWNLLLNPQSQLSSCKEILQSGQSTGDGVYDIVGDNGNFLSVYCDMTTDGGGWTLVGSFPKNHAGGVKNLTQYSDEPETSPNNPTKLWMYKGNLSRFVDVREQIACSQAQCADGKAVYGVNFSTFELEQVRTTWAYEDKVVAMPMRAGQPACRTDLSEPNTSYDGCSNPSYVTYTSTDTYVGWQGDVNGGYCWVARGTHKPNSLGSSLCKGVEPNGTKWALLWMR